MKKNILSTALITLLASNVFATTDQATLNTQILKMPQQTLPTPVSQPTVVPMGTYTNSDGLSIVFGGDVEVQYGYVQQKKAFKSPSELAANTSDNEAQQPFLGNDRRFVDQKGIAVFGDLNVTASKKCANGNEYGLYLDLNLDPSPSVSQDVNLISSGMLYAQGANGRVEAGTYDGAVANFTIDASSIAVATGGIGGDYSSWYTYGAVSKNDDPEEGNLNVKTILNGMFLTSTGLPVDNLENSNNNANKITYYSPEMNGFQMGISYIPDSAINGTTSDITGFNQMGFKDVFEGGIMYKMNNNNFNFQMSLTGEVGNARAGIIQYSKDPEARGGGAISDGDESSNVKSIIPINDLNAWQIGMQAEMGGFSFAASYSDWLNSGTATPSQATVINDPKSYSWSVGGAYQYDKVGFSVSYLKSEAQGLFTSSGWSQINNSSTTANAYVQSTNKFSAVSFGLEYDVQPNIAPYAEVTTFEYKTPLSNNNSGLPVNANKGTVFLTGLKLSF